MELWRKELYICHFGVLGQKWGDRNGPPYPLGASDHSVSEKEAGWRKSLGGGRNESEYGMDDKDKTKKTKSNYIEKLSKHYQNSLGMSKKEADEAALKKKELIKKIAIGAGITMAVAGSIYLANAYGKTFCDGIIKKGTTIQTLSQDPNRINNGRAFFEAHDELSKAKYIGVFGKGKAGGSLNDTAGALKYRIKAVANKDVRVATINESKKIFDNMMKNNKEFRDGVNQFNYVDKVKELQKHKVGGMGKMSPFYSIPRMFGDKYHAFNGYGEISNDPKSRKLVEMFHDELKKKGFAGLHDVNDRLATGINTNANILFDSSNFDIKESVKKLTQSEIAAGKRIFIASKVAELSPAAAASGAAVLGIAAPGVYDAKLKADYKNKKSKK